MHCLLQHFNGGEATRPEKERKQRPVYDVDALRALCYFMRTDCFLLWLRGPRGPWPVCSSGADVCL